MKIGVFLPDIDPKTGGGFTFVETVLGNAGESPEDNVVVFHYGSSDGLKSKVGERRIKFHSLASGPIGRLVRKTWYGQVTSRLQRPLHQAAGILGRRAPIIPASALDQAARPIGVDLMWFPSPMYEQVDIPYVITIWDVEHRLHPYFPELGAHAEWRWREKLFGDTLRRATYVVTGTSVGRDEIVRFYGVDRDRIRLLPHPTPTFALEAMNAPLAPLRLPVRAPYLFYPAQFWSHKNHVGLLRGVAELKRRGVTIDVAFVGSDKGNLEHVRERASALDIYDQVHFLGFVERADLVALYRNATALAYASLCGPENLPPLEAMALGCPVIAADIAGAREQLGDAALLVDMLDPGKIADAIQRVMTDGALRASLAAKGRARANQYTHVEFGRDLGAIFDEFRRRRDLWHQ
jgi:glycosyltransferase involved in cell wall biosynthesis